MTVVEQLTEYCDCLESVEERDVTELINIISTFTCWAQHPCETFLKSERREVIDIPDCVCDCDVLEFEPFFTPFEPDSFTFTLAEQNGITETLTEITNYGYSTADGKFRVELPLPECGCRPNCGCKSTYKLIVTYIAGYENIPDCLLPLFCEALQWIYEKNDCDCADCEPCNQNARSVGEIDYTTVVGRLQAHFLDVFTIQYFRQLALISLCRRRGRLWGIVV